MGPATETVGFLQNLGALGTMLLFQLLQCLSRMLCFQI